ncbi:MAG: hypothetical protein EPO64_07750 [Nitrospirae bacterium]|nr:MAG: hypothetical protein EPO64_07750 [Nitrospirota bacterium]
MKAACLAVAMVLLTGCATALKQEGWCLASLTPDYLQAQEELSSLEASWHRAMDRRNAALNAIPSRPTAKTATAPHSDPAISFEANTPGEARRTARQAWMVRQDYVGQDQPSPSTNEAYANLAEARARYQPMLLWYGKVYERVRTRMDEEEILSEVRMVLLPGPGVIFYPLIRWNIHSVFWDGTDPDAESDPVTRYCTDRLSAIVAVADRTPHHVE